MGLALEAHGLAARYWCQDTMRTHARQAHLGEQLFELIPGQAHLSRHWSGRALCRPQKSMIEELLHKAELKATHGGTTCVQRFG